MSETSAPHDTAWSLPRNYSAVQGRYEGPLAPVILSIVAGIVWLVFILVYALFLSNNFSLFQNVIVTIVSFSIGGLLVGLMWLFWFHPSGELRRPATRALGELTHPTFPETGT